MLAITPLRQSASLPLTSENGMAHENIWGSKFWKETVTVPPEKSLLLVGTAQCLNLRKLEPLARALTWAKVNVELKEIHQNLNEITQWDPADQSL